VLSFAMANVGNTSIFMIFYECTAWNSFNIIVMIIVSIIIIVIVSGDSLISILIMLRPGRQGLWGTLNLVFSEYRWLFLRG
jgi:hypothetical protein